MRRACALLLLALACAGCGDDKKGSTPSAPPLTDEKKAPPGKEKSGPGFGHRTPDRPSAPAA